MSPVEVRDLGEPEAVVTYPLGATYQVRLAGTVVSHHVLQPGWSWEAHVIHPGSVGGSLRWQPPLGCCLS